MKQPNSNSIPHKDLEEPTQKKWEIQSLIYVFGHFKNVDRLNEKN